MGATISFSRLACACLVLCAAGAVGAATAAGGGEALSIAPVAAARIAIPASDYTPTIPAGGARVHVDAFRIDERPVNNGEFLAFVRRHREWARGAAPALFADTDYLSHWPSADDVGDAADASRPVTRVSWFASRAYCHEAGGRLPTWAEWELVAAADATRRDARHEPTWREAILAWYAQPADAPLAAAGSGVRDAYGVRDLHGLVWEWVEDFDALLLGADSRLQGDPDKLAFCGAGAASVQDRENYPMLMRLAFLDSLRGASSARSLGFRCAYAEAP